MPPTESQILTSFLLPPAPLPTSLPLSRFALLFPPSAQSSPVIISLYHDLQSLRNEDIATVRKNIEAECQRGAKQIREMRRERRKRDVHRSDVKVGCYYNCIAEGVKC
jgi:centromere-localized protein 2